MGKNKFRIVCLILFLILSRSMEMSRSESPWIGSQEIAYSRALNIDLGIFHIENQTLYWSFVSTSDTINISIYTLAILPGEEGSSTLLAHGISIGEGSFLAEVSLNYSIRFVHLDWDFKDENTTVTAVITDTAPNSNAVEETSRANSSIKIVLSTIFIISFFQKKKKKNLK